MRFWLGDLVNGCGTNFGRCLTCSEESPVEWGASLGVYSVWEPCRNWREIMEDKAMDIWYERKEEDVWDQTRWVGTLPDDWPGMAPC